MKIYYQGIEGAYSHMATIEMQKHLSEKGTDIVGLPNFQLVWERINADEIGVLPIENSYAGSVQENLYGFLKHRCRIVGELLLPINHCLLSNEISISEIERAYAHPQALSQCYEYLKKRNIEMIPYGDNALAVKHISKSKEKNSCAIASSFAGELYNVNILDQDIQDQKNNTTRFFVVSNKNIELEYVSKSGKVSLFFSSKESDKPASLYKCLGAFATRFINLTKIESLSSLKEAFKYVFWIDCVGSLDTPEMKGALEELEFFTEEISILGEY